MHINLRKCFYYFALATITFNLKGMEEIEDQITGMQLEPQHELSLISKAKHSFLVKTELADLIPELTRRKQLSEIRVAKKLDAINILATLILLGYFDEQMDDYIGGILEKDPVTHQLVLNQDQCKMMIDNNATRLHLLQPLVKTMKSLGLNEIKEQLKQILLESDIVQRQGMQVAIRKLFA
jgi:hypothetical protein